MCPGPHLPDPGHFSLGKWDLPKASTEEEFFVPYEGLHDSTELSNDL